jgi:hypothetical protein
MAHTSNVVLGVSTRGTEPSLSNPVVSPIIDRLKHHNASFVSLKVYTTYRRRYSRDNHTRFADHNSRFDGVRVGWPRRTAPAFYVEAASVEPGTGVVPGPHGNLFFPVFL